MTWEYHRYALERARDRLKAHAEAAAELQQGVSLQGVAATDDAEKLDDVLEFLESLDGPKISDKPADVFVARWNQTVAQISVFARQFDLPVPEMIFHPRWLDTMRASSREHISSTLIYMDVKIRFGGFEQRDVLVSYPR